MLKLCYYHPNYLAGYYEQTSITSEMENFDEWVDYMLREAPQEAIFFFVRITTDVEFP